jgi:hypothetical protein
VLGKLGLAVPNLVGQSKPRLKHDKCCDDRDSSSLPPGIGCSSCLRDLDLSGDNAKQRHSKQNEQWQFRERHSAECQRGDDRCVRVVSMRY